MKRLRRVLAWVLAVLLVLSVTGVGAAGWYYSGLVIEPSHGSSYPLEVVAYTGDLVTLRGGDDTAAPGTYGLTWDGGNATLGAVVSTGGGSVVRRVEKVRRGTLRPGVRAYLDRWMWGHEDPGTALGLPYRKVSVPGELGDLPAWRTEGSSTTWVIAVHGRNATAAEALRFVPLFHSLGMPVLGISYRNDAGAPAGDGLFHLGATEWRDVAAAISYARGQGATGVLLHGFSMGGGIAPMTVRRMPGAPVKGLILDSPVLDWNAPIDLGADQRGVPRWLASVGKFVVERRTGASLDDVDHVRHAREFRTPVLLFVDDADASVPVGPALRFAAARPDLVTLVRTRGGGHVGSWNTDPGRYERALRDFATRVTR
ncbi:alpha/beta hydrolase [Nonomuraea rhodomycinica]|uniref:Prolyl oligopeptidase family serine peptidase n=1 Tax=Nonomuraea rhodomycinica TaxID=1712872 RepID=A0A7Y6ISM5_9ACTN|nr:prolyl oligopeptidase family serine peptidase [Nonomuraea rhodomycinica]NUW43676.1 prolyl oligopeptidase family serine peptidase [Nonomuraea rhodomycinica]